MIKVSFFTMYIININTILSENKPEMMNISLSSKLFLSASKNYGGPYCGVPLRNDPWMEGIKFWVSGVAVGSFGLPGNIF